ncbi:hypothetical protein [Arsenicicoccus dermatophilus]
MGADLRGPTKVVGFAGLVTRNEFDAEDVAHIRSWVNTTIGAKR